MKLNRCWLYLLIFLLAFAACTHDAKKEASAATPVVQTYKPVSQGLYDTIMRMDSILFAALKERDTVIAKELFTKDLEFYHDKGGLSGYNQNIQAFKTLFTKENGLTRVLVPGSAEVYPIKDYGAIQEGKHQFCHPENGKKDCGTFRFIHIWKKENSSWKISRIISYDH